MDKRYAVLIDRDHDGNFGEAGEDVSGDVLELRWRMGMRGPYESMADYGGAEIVLRNADGGYSPERNRLDISTRVRIESAESGESVVYFTGYVSHVTVDAGEGRSVIHLQDVLPWLEDSPAELSPMVDARADEAIDRLLDGAIVRREVLAGYCIIDVAGYNMIDSARVFPQRSLARSLQAGKTRFAYVGDWWGEGTSTRRAIRDLAESERGRFYIDRRGEPVFLHRHATLVKGSVQARFSDDMSGVDYVYGHEHVNRVSLLMRPREAGARGTVMWRLDRPQLIGARSSVVLTLRFTDEQDRPLGLLELEGLRAVFHHWSDGGGGAVTEGLSAVEVKRGFTSLGVLLRNDRSRDVFMTDLRVIGRPLYRRGALEIALGHGEGLHLYGPRSLRLDMPALSDIETGRAFAAYELGRRKEPSGAIREMRLDGREHAVARSLSLFDRIRVSESASGQSNREYFIVGESHHVRMGGAGHEVRWALEPADLADYVVVNSSRVDDGGEVIAPY